MHPFYLLLRIYPFWALPITYVFLQFGLFFRRRVKARQYFFWVFAFFFGMTSAAWFILRGDLNSDRWVTEFAEWIKALA